MVEGAGQVQKITKRLVDATGPRSDRFTIWDADLKGFGLRVSPSGTKTYVVRYRVGGGRKGTLRQMVVARHGVLTPDQARERARQVLAEVATGRDPQAARSARRDEMTMSELCDLYLSEGVVTKKSSTLALDRIRVARHIKPLIGRMRISEVGRAHIDRLMADIASGKVRNEATPHTRGGRGAASRTVGLLGGIFAFAEGRGLVSSNPTKGVKRYPDVRRERFLSPKELGRLGDVLTELEANGADVSHISIIRLLALTGARKNEIARLRWTEVDLEAGRLNLADSKTGKKSIALGKAALDVLASQPRGDSPFVFPDRRTPEKATTNLDWAWVGIREKAGLANVRIHDLRHSFASAAMTTGEGLPLVGKLLGHAHVSTTARYAHLADDPVRAAADRIAATVSAGLEGRAGGR